SPMWSKWPCVTSIRSHRSIESAVRGLRGLAKKGSSRITLPPGVQISKQECPYQVNVVSRPSAMWHLRSRCYQRGYTRVRARHADRAEPGVHQLDPPDRARPRVVRGGGPAPATG